MRLKLTLERPGGDSVDLTLVAEPTTTIEAVARELRRADPRRGAQISDDPVTLRLHTMAGEHRLLDPGTTVADSGLASGSVLSLAAPSTGIGGARRPAGAVIAIVAGPGAGTRHEVAVGTTSIGRDASNGVVLNDPLVSKAHARLRITDSVEIVDIGSANGTLVNGLAVDRATLAAGDTIVLGDTTLSIASVAHSGAVAAEGTVHFNRSPRLDPRYEGVKLTAPEIPEKPKPSRFPLLALLAPLLMGGVLLFLMPNNPLSFIFIALSPLLLLGSFIDGVIQARRQWKQALAEFRGTVASLSAQTDDLHAAERAGRLGEAPALARVLDEGARFQPLLWTRRPEHDVFLTLRLGLGTMPSRHTLEIPERRSGPPELWNELTGLAAKMRFVEQVPVVEHFREAGSIGIAGPLDRARAVARGAVAQLAGLHSPAEVCLVGVASTQSAAAWDWLKWLPHVGSAHSPLGGNALAAGGPDAIQLLSALDELIDGRLAEDREAPALPAIVVLVEDDAPVDRARLVAIGERGPAAGVHLLWVAPALSRLPAAARTFIDLGTGAAFTGFVHTGAGVHPVECEELGLAEATTFARTLAPAVDAGAPVDDASDLPRAASLLGILGADVADRPESVIGRWQETNSILTGPYASPPNPKSRANLRAVFGQAATEPFALDLRADGPHALVGGTTGSGKSEFLQAWVLAMAAAHSPERLAFLFVDYKGGAAFADSVDLPHSVGLVTDLSPHLVRRALTSLRAELRFREHLFQRKKVKDIVEFEKTGDPELPPSLVIVVDEFAALVSEVPEFVDGVVDVAQRGRSLGLHLILATQRPAGVIKDNLRANTNLRIALRVAEDSDSIDVLGVPLAAGFDAETPGRGAARTGPGRIRVFQAGYAGGWTGDDILSAPAIAEMRFGAGAQWEAPPDPVIEAKAAKILEGPTDIKRVVANISEAAKAADLPEPRKPWLPELAREYNFAKLPNARTDAELLLGVLDDAATQSQPTVAYLPDRDGNLAIVGTGGSGKTTALRTIAVAAAVTVRGGPAQVYGIDFASGGLPMLEKLPHVGAVVSGDDEERLGRLLRWLRDVVDERKRRYPAAGAASIVEYRTQSGITDEPRILLLLDGLGAFRDQYEASISSPWFSLFSEIATDGRSVGVHVVVTADRIGSIPASLASSIQRRLVLRLANRDEYNLFDVPGDVLDAASPPGRGLIGSQEVQIAVLGGNGNVAAQDRELEALAEAMTKAGVVPAPGIRRLPDLIHRAAAGNEATTLGIADDTLEPVQLRIDGGFIVAGPPGSGRTNALAVIGKCLRESDSIDEVFLLSPRRSQVHELGEWTAAASGMDAVSALIPKIQKAAATAEKKDRRIAVIVEALTGFDSSEVETELEDLLRSTMRSGHAVVGEAETSTWRDSYTLGGLVRSPRRGLVLCPESDDEALLRTDFGRLKAPFPPGRGFLVDGPSARKLQVVWLGGASDS